MPGRCCDASKISLWNASHPYVDNIYVAITCCYVFLALGWAVLFRFVNNQGGKPLLYRQFLVFIVAMLQYPLHVYSIFAFRASNEDLLSGRNIEQEWGYGQIVSLGLNLVVLLNGGRR